MIFFFVYKLKNRKKIPQLGNFQLILKYLSMLQFIQFLILKFWSYSLLNK